MYARTRVFLKTLAFTFAVSSVPVVLAAEGTDNSFKGLNSVGNKALDDTTTGEFRRFEGAALDNTDVTAPIRLKNDFDASLQARPIAQSPTSNTFDLGNLNSVNVSH